MCFGWTWEYIDEYMTVPRLLEIFAYFRRVPPLHEAFAAFVGLLNPGGAASSSSSAPLSEDAAGEALIKDLFGAGFVIGPGILPGG